MDNKDSLKKLYELLEKEIKRITDKGDISPNELESAMKAVCLMEKLEAMMYGEGGYSEYGSRYSRDGSYSRDGYYGESGRRGRSSVTGRYVSRDSGYSGHSIKDRMISNLEHMMDDSNSEYERQEISRWINTLEMGK